MCVKTLLEVLRGDMFYLCQVKSLWNWMQHQKANLIDLVAILAKLDGSHKGRAITVLVELKCQWKRKSHHPLLLLNFGLRPSNILLVRKVSPLEKNFTFGPRIYINIITMYKQAIATPQGWKKYGFRHLNFPPWSNPLC